MANEPWGLSDLTYTPFVLLAPGTEFKLKFKIFNGSTYIEVVNDKTRESVLFKSLSAIYREILIDNFDIIMAAGPETRRPIVIGAWNKNERKFMTDYIIELYKDSKMIYHICVMIKGNKWDFTLNGPNGVSIGSEPLSAPDRSTYVMKALKRWFDLNAVVQSIISNKRRDPSTFRGKSRTTSESRVENETSGGGGSSAPSYDNSDVSGSDYF